MSLEALVAVRDVEQRIKMRDVASETSKEQTGSSPAVSSYKALMYNLVSPHVIRRLATRLTVGGKKYGLVQWRIGVNDKEYISDRFNHLWEHLLLFMEAGDKSDDNLGAMMWALHCLMEVERLAPESFKNIVGMCDLFGQTATEFHECEMAKKKERFHSVAKELDNVITGKKD